MTSKKTTYFLDGERFSVTNKIITPNEIFKKKYPLRDVYDYYLVVISERSERIDFKDKMAQPVIVDKDMNFRSIKR